MIKIIKLKIENEYFAELPLITDNEEPRNRAPGYSGCQNKKNPGIEISSGIKAFISLKNAGDMHIENQEVRKKYFAMHEIEYGRVSGLHQVHSKDIKIVTDKSYGYNDKGDGLITSNKQAVLAVTVADCIPICLYDKGTGVFGVLHSGWRGTGIIENAVNLLKEKYNSKPENIFITIGPGIGSCCYEVSKDLYDKFTTVYGKNTVSIINDKYFIDLKQVNINLLKQFNIENITVIEDCTFCNNLLSSLRRDGKDNFIRMNVSIGMF